MSAAVITAAHPALIRGDRRSAPHLGAGQVVRAAAYAPQAPRYLGIKSDPVGRVSPAVWNSLRRTSPRTAAVIASEQSDIGVSDKFAPAIKRIEMDSVACGHVQTGRGPRAVGDSPRVNGGPRTSAVTALHSPAKVCRIAKIRIVLCDPDHEWILAPVGAEPFRDPGIVHVRCRDSGFLPYKIPVPSEIGGFRYTLPGVAIKIQTTVRDIRRTWNVQAGCDCAYFCARPRQNTVPPATTRIGRNKRTFLGSGIERSVRATGPARGKAIKRRASRSRKTLHSGCGDRIDGVGTDGNQILRMESRIAKPDRSYRLGHIGLFAPRLPLIPAHKNEGVKPL